jgi:hypothetical protein
VSAPLAWDEIADADPADFTLRTMPARFGALGDRHEAIDRHVCSLAPLLELVARHEAEGLGDAPWPPHYRKQAGEPARVAPSRRRRPAPSSRESTGEGPSSAMTTRGSGRRQPKHPLVEIARARQKEDAVAGLERWKARHPDAARYLEPADVMVDAMRGRFRTWTRIRVNLQHVPVELRPPQEPLDPDGDVNDWNVSEGARSRQRPARARKES